MRAALALLKLLRPLIVNLGGSQDQKKEFAAEQETHVQELGEQWKSAHRQALFTNVGLALSQWAGMEELLVGIASLLLRTHEANKVGIILYSIMNFNVWLSVIDDLFLQEPRYITLKPKWNKIHSRLMGLKDTRDRLAHHGEKFAHTAGDTSLRRSRFDFRQKSQKFQPLDFDQISKFIVDLDKVQESLTSLLNSMTDILTHETSQQKSSEPTLD